MIPTIFVCHMDIKATARKVKHFRGLQETKALGNKTKDENGQGKYDPGSEQLAKKEVESGKVLGCHQYKGQVGRNGLHLRRPDKNRFLARAF